MSDEREAASAYAGTRSRFVKMLGMGALAVLALMLFLNVLFRDYQTETVKHLRSTNPEYDAKVMSSWSPAEMQKQFSGLVADMEGLKQEVSALQYKINNLPTSEPQQTNQQQAEAGGDEQQEEPQQFDDDD